MKRLKMKVMVVLVLIMTVFMPIVVLANDPAPLLGVDLADAMTKGIGNMATEIMAIIAAILPTVLMIVGAVIAIKKGLTLIRSMVGS